MELIRTRSGHSPERHSGIMQTGEQFRTESKFHYTRLALHENQRLPSTLYRQDVLAV
jgi:hypothetical protein